MADMLQDQYTSVFSTPDDQSGDPLPQQPGDEAPTLEDFTFTQDDFISALKEIGEHSASSEYDIPAIILKHCAEAISYPILLIWRDSLLSGFIPQTYKNQIITPVFKKGSKAIRANYIMAIGQSPSHLTL